MPWLKFWSHRTIFSSSPTHFSDQFFHLFGRILDRNMYEDNGGMAPKLSGGPIPIKIPNICCVIYDLTSNEVLMTQKLRKTKFFHWKNGCMTLKLLWGPFLIQIYNIEPLLAWAIKTTKVNTVCAKHCSVTSLTSKLLHSRWM